MSAEGFRVSEKKVCFKLDTMCMLRWPISYFFQTCDNAVNRDFGKAMSCSKKRFTC